MNDPNGGITWRMGEIERRVGRLEGLDSRLAVLERDVNNIAGDLGGIAQGQERLRSDVIASQRGMSRPEKIALGGTAAALISALIAVVAMLAGGPPG